MNIEIVTYTKQSTLIINLRPDEIRDHLLHIAPDEDHYVEVRIDDEHVSTYKDSHSELIPASHYELV